MGTSRKFVDLTGVRFSKLTVVKRVDSMPEGSAAWLCICECGGQRVAITAKLKARAIKSCGCDKREINSKRATKHGLTKSRLYNIHKGMISRCYNTANKAFSNYGGRGIKVCDRWKKFVNFYEDVIESYRDDLSLERIDVNLDYEKQNCKWIPRANQNDNKRNTSRVIFMGAERTLKDLASIYGILPQTVRYRIKVGWDTETAVTKPARW